jgi:predicted ATPase
MASIAAFFDVDGLGTRALLIEGAAGIGKTTLWEHAAQLAQNDRPALVARPSQAEAQLSFSVLGDLFSPELIQSMDELPSNQRSALEAALLLGSTTSSPDVRAVSLAVLGGIRSLASAHPITIAIDDVQWIDALSARVLAYALRRLADDQVTIVAAQRLERCHGSARYRRSTRGCRAVDSRTDRPHPARTAPPFATRSAFLPAERPRDLPCVWRESLLRHRDRARAPARGRDTPAR